MKRERGYILLAALALVIVASAVVLVSGSSRLIGRQDLRAQRATLQALQTAREALLARAVAEDNTPGTLPCPSPDESGNTVTDCAPNSVGVIGRLPWKSLGTTPLLDGDGECLWYALSVPQRNSVPGQYREESYSPTAYIPSPPINPATTPTLIANGTEVVAVVFAPGNALVSQTIRGTGNGFCRSGSADQYLESLSVAGSAVTTPITSPAPGNNDQILVITQHDVMKLVAARTLRRLARSGLAFSDGPLSNTRSLDETTQRAFDEKLLVPGDELNNSAVTASRCRSVRTLVNGVFSPFTYNHPASSLCLNDWYPKISFDSSKNLLSVNIPPALATGSPVVCSATPGNNEVTCV